MQDTIRRRLGWLDSPALMLASVDRIRSVASEVRHAGFTDVVLLGMGGSSLAPEVLRAVVGEQSGWLRLHLLDTTDPDAVRAVATTPARTIYLLASKSGTTIEPNSLAAHFQRVLQDSGIDDWAKHFIAITDDETPLSSRARTEGFRHVFLNPFDIGGRYSALSFFGLVPAALMGQDISALLNWGGAMLEEAQDEDVDVRANPAVALGLLMGAAAQAKRNKLTLILPSGLERFGLWVEQLVAESTGKRGVGIVPIAGETIGDEHVYGHDRAFVRLRRPDAPRRKDREVQELQHHEPIATIEFPEPAALGAEFVRWEIATAVAGALLGINPFDEPNVQQAKDATRVLLDRYKTDHHLPASAHETTSTGVKMSLTSAARQALHGKGPEVDPDGPRARRLPGGPLLPRTNRGHRRSAAAFSHVGPRHDARCDDVELRSAVSAFHGAAAQRRAEHRRVCVDHGAARKTTWTSLDSRSRSARSSSHKRSATSHLLVRRIGERFMCICRLGIRAS